MNLRTEKTIRSVSNMIKQIGLFLIVSFFIQVHAVAQMYSEATKIEIISGVNSSMATILEDKTEALLKAVNDWANSTENTFPNEPGALQLKEIVGTLNLVASYDSLSTFVMSFDGNKYEIPRIFLRPKQGNKYQFTELILSFSDQGELLRARVAPQLQNINRILSRAIAVSPQEQQLAEEFLAGYKNLLVNKKKEQIRELFSEEAFIVTGSRNSGTKTFEYTRFETESYLTRLENYTLVPGNEIDIVFDSVEAYRHPDFNQVLGIKVYQHWNTTNYSDKGNLFFIVDFSGKEPLLVARSWQKRPFKSGEFTSIQPEPMDIFLHQSDVQFKNEKGENYAYQLELNEGLIELKVKASAENDEILNAEVLEEWVSDYTIELSNVDVNAEGITILDRTTLKIPFSVNWQEGQQTISSTINIKETTLLKGLSQEVELFLQRKNTLDLYMLGVGEEIQQKETESYFGEISIASNVSEVDVEIHTVSGQLLKNIFKPDSLFHFSLAEGDYKFTVGKEDYLSSFFETRITRSKDTEYSLDLKPVEMPALQLPVAKEKSSFFGKNKYWILGGAAALVTSSMLLMSNGPGGGDTGIPIPPGRPN